jgi:hypothetical protein
MGLLHLVHLAFRPALPYSGCIHDISDRLFAALAFSTAIPPVSAVCVYLL